MCGIAGLADSASVADAAPLVEAMKHAMQRRGRDAEGSAAWATAMLGHRRLSIFDLSERGRQPMLSDDGAAGIVFNGAIYNFPELKQELAARGCTFRSTTDTEVLLHGYREWGIDALVRRLRGMFAFGLWDDRERSLFLVRDRLGVKPLLFARRGDRIAFASTAGALRAAGFGGDLDAQAVADFLEWGVVPEQRSIVAGIEKLPPATIGTWRNGRLTTQCYWSPPEAAAAGSIHFEEAVEETERLFLQAVRRRTLADVPIGALLSGGVDSALVCWALRELGSEVRAFTFASPGAAEDESEDARLTARELGIAVEVLGGDGDAVPLAELRQAYSEPFGCGSALGMLRLSRAVRAHATVLITGDGGDDVFLGYPQHRFLLRAQRLAAWLPRPLAAAWAHAGQMPPVNGAARRPRQFAGYVAGGLGVYLRVRPDFRYLAQRGLLGERLRGVLPASRTVPIVPGSGRTVLDDYLAWDRQHQFVAEYMAKVDGAAMHHSLEARSPFLDQDLWEFAAALPYEIRLHGGRLKAVLRELASRRISPRVALGSKRGFRVPLDAYIRGGLRGQADAALAASSLAADGWLRTDAIPALMSSADAPILPLWYTVVLADWYAAACPTPPRGRR